MAKGNATINAITIVSMGVIAALMFSEIPSMMDDIRAVLSKTSVIGKASDIADLLTLATSSSGEIKIIYKLPEDISYTVFVKDGYVNVSTGSDWAVSKTTSRLCFKFDPVDEACKPDIVKILLITKNSIEKVD